MNDWSGLIDDQRLAELEPSAARELLRHALTEENLAESRRVFTNRAMRMEKIRDIGFDLDWTLAAYDPDALSELAFEMTLDRLVERHGYPREILRAEFRSDFCRRGLILDTEAGTVLKMNRHRYVGRAFHGYRYLDVGERARLYRQEPVNPASNRYYFVDTLFELPEVNIFSELIDLAEHRSRSFSIPPYTQLHRDTRKAIDSIHADDTLKHRILDDLERYLPRDPELALALERMSMGGRRLLLITNSEWYYTDALCTHLFDGALPGLATWRDLFDLVVVSAAKPGFFRKARPFTEIDTDGREAAQVDVPSWGGLYAGGSRENLMRLLDGPGEEMLYVGDTSTETSCPRSSPRPGGRRWW